MYKIKIKHIKYTKSAKKGLSKNPQKQAQNRHLPRVPKIAKKMIFKTHIK